MGFYFQQLTIVHCYGVHLCKSTYFFLASSYCQLSLTLSASSDGSWGPNCRREITILNYWANMTLIVSPWWHKILQSNIKQLKLQLQNKWSWQTSPIRSVWQPVSVYCCTLQESPRVSVLLATSLMESQKFSVSLARLCAQQKKNKLKWHS